MKTRYRTIPTLIRAKALEQEQRRWGYNARTYKSKNGFTVIWSAGFIRIAGAVKA